MTSNITIVGSAKRFPHTSHEKYLRHECSTFIHSSNRAEIEQEWEKIEENIPLFFPQWGNIRKWERMSTIKQKKRLNRQIDRPKTSRLHISDPVCGFFSVTRCSAFLTDNAGQIELQWKSAEMIGTDFSQTPHQVQIFSHITAMQNSRADERCACNSCQSLWLWQHSAPEAPSCK